MTDESDLRASIFFVVGGLHGKVLLVMVYTLIRVKWLRFRIFVAMDIHAVFESLFFAKFE